MTAVVVFSRAGIRLSGVEDANPVGLTASFRCWPGVAATSLLNRAIQGPSEVARLLNVPSVEAGGGRDCHSSACTWASPHALPPPPTPFLVLRLTGEYILDRHTASGFNALYDVHEGPDRRPPAARAEDDRGMPKISASWTSRRTASPGVARMWLQGKTSTNSS